WAWAIKKRDMKSRFSFRKKFLAAPAPVLKAGGNAQAGLLQLGFLVFDVLARDRIELLDQHLFRRRALVLGRGVEVPGARGGLELDLFTYTLGHGVLLWTRWLNGFAAGAQVRQHGLDAVLVDGAQRARAHAQANPAVFAFDPELAVLQVREEAALGLVV